MPARRCSAWAGSRSEDLADVLGSAPSVGGSTRAPGTLPAHYAPNARVEIVTSDTVADRARDVAASERRVGVVALASDLAGVDLPDALVPLARSVDVAAYAHDLYRALREADALGLDVVLAIAPPPGGLGVAVADRLGAPARSH